MKILICICDFWQQCDYLQIDNKYNVEKVSVGRELTTTATNRTTKNQLGKDRKSLRRLHLVIDGISAFYLLREIKEFTEFRMRISENPALREMELLWLQLEQPKKDIIDYKWYDYYRTLSLS